MNCLEYRREKLADPRRLSAAAQVHAGSCETCRRFGLSVDEQDARLAQVFLVPVPDGLAERALLRAGARLPVPPRLLALAASILITFAAGSVLWHDDHRGDVGRLAIEHVMHEPESLTTVRSADPELFRTVLYNFGAEMQGPLGHLRYMKLCPVPGGTGWHMVFETESGLATLILVPRTLADAHPREANLGPWSALARPAGQGYYVIIADSPESLRRVDRLVGQRLRWRG